MMEATLKRLTCLPKAIIKISGEYIEAKNSHTLGLEDSDFLDQNVKQYLGAETWFDILLNCYKNKIHIQESLVNLPSGRTKLNVRYEMDDNLIYCQVLNISKLSFDDVVNPESIFYNWLDKQQLEGASVIPNFESRELAVLFRSAEETKKAIRECTYKYRSFVTNINVHKYHLKEIFDKIVIFKDHVLYYPVLTDTIRSNVKGKAESIMLAEAEIYRERKTINPWDSLLIKNNPGFLNLHVGDCITIMSMEPGFKYLGAWAGFDPRQFNKPIETMVGNNYDIIDADLARKLHDSLQRLLKNGIDQYEYTHGWRGYKWKMQKHGAILDAGNGRREIVYKTTYPDDVKAIQTTRFLTLMEMER